MKGIELYINQQLCDIGNIKDFSIYLKRQFIQPGELSSKDAQRSYDITLPASPRNNDIFGYIQIEEVKSKFTTLYDAVLIMNGIKIFEGKFKLSEISHNHYKGNLGIPYTKTIKEIFGDKNMNEVGEWSAKFEEIKDITDWNKKDNEDTKFFFPLVMYGLLPKVPQTSGIYSAKSVIDDTVRFGLEDFPPSINCLEAVKKIFEAKNISLTGSAFSDKRLTELYMSYKNPTDYAMPWPYKDLASMHIKGFWTNATFLDKNDKKPLLFEMNTYMSTSDVGKDVYTCNLLSSTNLENDQVLTDPGNNISYFEKKRTKYKINGKEDQTRTEKHYSIQIPQSGYYKIKLNGSLHIPRAYQDIITYNQFSESDPNTNIMIRSADYGTRRDEYFNDKRYELKLIRDRKQGDFGLDKVAIDGIYYQNNLRQKREDLKGSEFEPTPAESTYYPPIYNPSYSNVKDYKPNQAIFVDPAQNENLVIGLSWGLYEEGRENTATPLDPWKPKSIADDTDRTKNPVCARTLVAKSCYSWNNEYKDKTLSKVIVGQDHGYWIYSKDEELVESTNFTKNIGVQSEEKIEPRETSLYKMVVKDAPRNYARRGFYRGEPQPITNDIYYNKPINRFGDGEVNAIVWLEKGERLTVVSSTDSANDPGWIWHRFDFELSIDPYRTDKGWANINEYTGSLILQKDEEGNDIPLDWNSTPSPKNDFRKGTIDLIKFLPSNVKIDDWLSNFCKAFNLELTQTGKDKFELNLKKIPNQNSATIINLDGRANICINRQNTPFNLPATYEIGFTSDKNEIGYVESAIRYENDEPIKDEQGNIKIFEGDDGGGRFDTGSTNTNKVNQTSNFSYNWRKKIKQSTNTSDSNFYESGEFPIISDKEVWENDSSDYGSMMLKNYQDKAQRFWYKSNNLYKVKVNNKVEIETSLTTDAYESSNPLTLNYKNTPNSILRNYFMVLTDANNCFTTIECYLHPEEYTNLEYSLIQFNGDLYYVAEIDGYDPLGIKKANLKLIRRMI